MCSQSGEVSTGGAVGVGVGGSSVWIGVIVGGVLSMGVTIFGCGGIGRVTTDGGALRTGGRGVRTCGRGGGGVRCFGGGGAGSDLGITVTIGGGCVSVATGAVMPYRAW